MNDCCITEKECVALPPVSDVVDTHVEEIRRQVEEAKDLASYETYGFGISESDTKISLFTARRKGLGHRAGKTPCQDYCLATSVNGCTVLADADGVGSCAYADIGSNLACCAVAEAVKAVTESCVAEEQLVARLLSVSFRERLVSGWVKSVMKRIGDVSGLPQEDQLREFRKYGSTVMFAVITENWIVAGCLGDGQVLVFNEQYGVKLRVHGPKYSSNVRCLINERCAREDFVVAKYPRSCFTGVLLSSDGIYESFDKGNLFFSYCIQAKERFLGRTPHEPYQAFCYKEDGEPYKDFSRMRTEDDCSIAMAVDERVVASDHEAVMAGVLRHSQAALLRRWAPECVSFYVKDGEGYSDVVVSNDDNCVTLPEKLEAAVLDVPKETWQEGSRVFSKYVERYEEPDLASIEEMFCTGALRLSREHPRESAQRILDVYRRIRELEKELSGYGLELNSSAGFNMAYDGRRLHVRKEALSCIGGNPPTSRSPDVEKYFCHLLGVLESGDEKEPVFDIGYVDRGRRHYRAGHAKEELAQLLRVDKKIHLKNISSYPWRLDGGGMLQPGESVELPNRLEFTLVGDNGESLETYRYFIKEAL